MGEGLLKLALKLDATRLSAGSYMNVTVSITNTGTHNVLVPEHVCGKGFGLRLVATIADRTYPITQQGEICSLRPRALLGPGRTVKGGGLLALPEDIPTALAGIAASVSWDTQGDPTYVRYTGETSGTFQALSMSDGTRTFMLVNNTQNPVRVRLYYDELLEAGESKRFTASLLYPLRAREIARAGGSTLAEHCYDLTGLEPDTTNTRLLVSEGPPCQAD